MKKLLSMVLVFVLCAVFCGAAAEGLDMSGYSDEGLTALLAQVQQEIADRHIEKTAELPAGTYLGGRDVPAGAYVLAASGIEGQAGIVSLRSVNDADNDWPSKLYEFERAENHFTVYIVLEEGDTLVLPFPFTLTISGGLQFK